MFSRIELMNIYCAIDHYWKDYTNILSDDERDSFNKIQHTIRTTLSAPIPTSPYKRAYEQDGKIAAIKAYRIETGASLIEAKKEIERLAREENWKAPLPF